MSTSALIPQSRSPAGSSKICRTDQVSADRVIMIRPAARAGAPMPRSSYSSQ